MGQVLAINSQASICRDKAGQLQLTLNIENAAGILELLQKAQGHPKFLDSTAAKDSDYSSAGSAGSVSSDDDGKRSVVFLPTVESSAHGRKFSAQTGAETSISRNPRIWSRAPRLPSRSAEPKSRR